MKASALLGTFLSCLVVTGSGGARTIAGEQPAPEPADRALTRLVAETLRTHPEVAAAAAALEASDAFEQAAARPAFNPELELGIDNSQSDERTLGITQTVEMWGQRSARTSVATFEREAAHAALSSARRDVTAELLAALADYHVAEGRHRLMQRRLDLMRRFADLASRRRRAGDLTRVDLAAAQLALAQAGIERASAAGDLAEAEQALGTLAPDRSGAAWPELPTELPRAALAPSDLDRAIAGLPDVRAQRALAAAAEARVDLRQRERRPNPTFGVRGGDEEGESLIGLTFSIPLHVRNRFTHEVVAARAGQRQAERSAANIEARARGRLLAARKRYALTRDAWSGWVATGEPNLTEQTALLERLWEAGDLSLTDYLVQLNQTFDTAASALDLKRELWRAWFEWLQATGRVGAWVAVPVE